MTEDTPTPPAWQFTAPYLYLLVAIFALSLLPFARWGVWAFIPSAWLTAIGISLLHKRYVMGASLFGLLVLCGLLYGGPTSAREARRRAVCTCNLRNIAIALQNYESAHGFLPPPYTTDDNGNPLHSWRVLILPYIEEGPLYEEIDLTKPWHHPDNISLVTRIPQVYQCPSFEPTTPTQEVTTAYVAVVGDHTAWPRSGKRQFCDIVDDPSQTVAVLESERHRIHWMSTADPGVEMMGPRKGDGETPLTHGPHHGISMCAFCDGHVEYLPEDIDLDDLRALITIDGGDKPKNAD